MIEHLRRPRSLATAAVRPGQLTSAGHGCRCAWPCLARQASASAGPTVLPLQSGPTAKAGPLPLDGVGTSSSSAALSWGLVCSAGLVQVRRIILDGVWLVYLAFGPVLG